MGIAVREMIDGAFEEAKALLPARMKDLNAGAALLLERETIILDEFPPIRRSAGLPAATAPELAVSWGMSGQISRSGADA